MSCCVKSQLTGCLLTFFCCCCLLVPRPAVQCCGLRRGDSWSRHHFLAQRWCDTWQLHSAFSTFHSSFGSGFLLSRGKSLYGSDNQMKQQLLHCIVRLSVRLIGCWTPWGSHVSVSRGVIHRKSNFLCSCCHRQPPAPTGLTGGGNRMFVGRISVSWMANANTPGAVEQ